LTYVIAEVGSNWQTREQAIESVGIAKAVGADAVKFQAFTVDALYGMPFDFIDQELGHGEVAACSVYNTTLPLEWLPQLKEKADACGIDFLCTAFSPELVKAVDPFVKMHKVASSDLAYPQLLHEIRTTGKPVLLSTGASSLGDIKQALWCLQDVDVTLLYCVASYPARTIDLRTIDLMRSVFSVPVGFSDHSTDIIGLPVEAVEQYAIPVLEKHFTAFHDLVTPDRPHSLTSDEFKTMVDHIRGRRGPVVGPTSEEQAMIFRHNRRLIATQDIAAGETMRYGVNFGAYRSLVDDARGLTPFTWEQVEGKVATAVIKRGAGVGPGDFA
jgi:N,N'-diacetyllegionaminate synthase